VAKQEESPVNNNNINNNKTTFIKCHESETLDAETLNGDKAALYRYANRIIC